MCVLPRRVALLRSSGVSWEEEPDLTLLRREEAVCVVCLLACFHLTLEIVCEILPFDYHIYIYIYK